MLSIDCKPVGYWHVKCSSKNVGDNVLTMYQHKRASYFYYHWWTSLHFTCIQKVAVCKTVWLHKPDKDKSSYYSSCLGEFIRGLVIQSFQEYFLMYKFMYSDDYSNHSCTPQNALSHRSQLIRFWLWNEDLGVQQRRRE